MGPMPQPQPDHSSGQLANAPKKDTFISPKKRMGRPPAAKVRRVTSLLPILPTPETTAPETTAQEAVGNATNITSDEARQRILELRKARNRASAVRSNEKKKKQAQILKDNLGEAKQQEAAPREKERELVEENVALREQLD